MKKFILVLMIAFCIGLGGKTKKSLISHTSRWRDKEKKFPYKVLHYFLLITRLLTMYKSSKITEDMIWHHKEG